MKKVLVTGGAGFIGSHIVDKYITDGWDVTVVDDLSTGKEENLNPGAKFYQISIVDEKLALVFKKDKFDLINHHAAQINVRLSIEKPEIDAKINILGTLNLLNKCLEAGVKNFIFASSGGAIYGEAQNLPVDEHYPKNPLSPYGIAKWTVESYLYFYKKVFGLNYVSLRYGNVYGPRQDPFGEAGVVAIFSNKMLKKNVPTIFGDGEQTRDYVFVGDVAEANLLATYKMKRLNCKDISSIDDLTYNIGTGGEESVNSLYQKLASITGFQSSPLHDDPKQGEVRRICLSPTKAKKELGWEPKISLEEGLSKTVNWTLSKFRQRLIPN